MVADGFIRAITLMKFELRLSGRSPRSGCNRGCMTSGAQSVGE
jgi:hypothetical protein